MRNLTAYIIFFHLIFDVSCQQSYVPKGRSLHTATLIGTKIYFLGGSLSRLNYIQATESLNDFFYLDISKPFDKTKEALPFVDLSERALEIPLHCGASTFVIGESKNTIFLYSGNVEDLNNTFSLTYSFNTTQLLNWKPVIASRGLVPPRKQLTGSVIDNNGKIHIFSGGIIGSKFPTNYYSNGMDVFDTNDQIWINIINSQIGINGRDGHTATFLPDTGEIVYIGGHTYNGKDVISIDMDNLDVYNTINGTWYKWITKNPPEQRYGHTAVLTNDKRIIVFGGSELDLMQKVKTQYVVLDTKTLEWYHGTEAPSAKASFRHHTATLYNDYMFIAFGCIYSEDTPYTPLSNDIFIYKIGDYANFTELSSFGSESTIKSTKTNVISIIFGILGVIIVFGLVGFFIYKRYKKSHVTSRFVHVIGC